jgi:hypothetical protein
MLKLYNRTGRAIEYHEAWVDDRKVVEHWGKLGERGSTREHVLMSKMSAEDNVRRVLASALAQGFEPIDIDEHATLLVEYRVDGMGSTRDVDKRHALEDRLNETLGWTGLGKCDGGSIGSGTMEVCCFVVDFATAKRVVEADLAGSEFADYSRIYDEGAG